jgi:serine/threonine protein kinase
MNDSSALPQSCPQCGAALRAEATEGLCPRCLMAQAMQPSLVAEDGMMATNPAQQPRAVAADFPLPEELTVLLPADTYRVQYLIGRGGMGAVYKGAQLRLLRPVAIKIMRRDQGRDHDFEQRFQREALAMAKLNHPNIVSVIDYGEAGTNYLYIVMELVEGADMMDVLRTGRMTQEMALRLLPQICDALQFAHDHGIIHRDIKPSNIMLTRDGRIKMCDFGLAKRHDVESSFHTQSGTGMGTPDYAAPEQFSADASIDHRADIYALGVMIYQMLTGQLPRGVWKPPTQHTECDPQWDEIVSHAMQTDPKDRYQAASEVKTDVSQILDGRAAAPSATLPKSRAPLLFGLITGAVVLGIGAFFALKKPHEWSAQASSVRSESSEQTSTNAQGTLEKSAPLPTGTVDLLTLADFVKDAEGGIWRREGADLIVGESPETAGSRGVRFGFALPVRVKGSYQLEVEFTKHGPMGTVCLVLPLPDGRSVVAHFQEANPYAGLVQVRGYKTREAENPTRVPHRLENERRYRGAVKVLLKGDQVEIAATFEGKPLFQFQGPVTDLESSRLLTMTDPARPGLRSIDPVTWHSVRITPLDGGTLTPVRDGVAMPAAKP